MTGNGTVDDGLPGATPFPGVAAGRGGDAWAWGCDCGRAGNTGDTSI